MEEIWFSAAWIAWSRLAECQLRGPSILSSHWGMFPSTVIELSVRFRVSYVPWWDPRFSMTGMASPAGQPSEIYRTDGGTHHEAPALAPSED